jgi:hypothetical protein
VSEPCEKAGLIRRPPADPQRLRPVGGPWFLAAGGGVCPSGASTGLNVPHNTIEPQACGLYCLVAVFGRQTAGTASSVVKRPVTQETHVSLARFLHFRSVTRILPPALLRERTRGAPPWTMMAAAALAVLIVRLRPGDCGRGLVRPAVLWFSRCRASRVLLPAHGFRGDDPISYLRDLLGDRIDFLALLRDHILLDLADVGVDLA